MRIATGLLLVAFSSTPCLAQSNVIPGTDVELGLLTAGSGDFANLGHDGPNLAGTSAFSMATTSCNPGTVDVPWQAPMQENHPLIAFMVMREDPNSDRMIQISDRSWLKHAFFALSNNQCNYGCSQVSGGTFLAIGCSDTYGISNNSNRYYLGPPEEIDPWLGTWTANGSFFDCPTGTGCNGGRTYMGVESSPLTHRINIEDSELDVAGARFFYYGYYVILGEPEANRVNNGNSREFTPTWNGNSWDTAEFGPHLQGTPLQRWTGSTLTSEVNTNGGQTRDGRVYVAHKITPNGSGYRYEYALHNRDNNGGIGEFRLPIGSNAAITNFYFHDVDLDAGNDWNVTITNSEIVLSTTDNPLAWNTVYNFGFDSIAPPVARDLELVQYVQNPGAAASFAVSLEGPSFGAAGEYPVSCQGNGGDLMGCTDCPCGNNTAPGTNGGCINSSGNGTVLAGFGDASVTLPSGSTTDLYFTVEGAPAAATCVLISGNAVAPQNMASPCFGTDGGILSGDRDGLRCVVQATVRHGNRSSNASGMVMDPAGPSRVWGGAAQPVDGIAVQAGFVAGQTRFFQITHRDSPLAVCTRGLNTSQAVEITFEP